MESLRHTIVARLPAESGEEGKVSKLPIDTVAWAIMTLWRQPELRPGLTAIGDHLDQGQLPDGRVPIDPQFPEVAWPTALAILAWAQQPVKGPAIQKAADFLLHWQGYHYRKTEVDPLGHDTALRGWPWITGTHSWIEPTALVLLALKKAGLEHPRCQEARRMILNRQLASGGWNYGNTTVFGQELRPMVHSTGMALTAMAGYATETEVRFSLNYLDQALLDIRSPLSLGWGIMGLTCWQRRPTQVSEWISECLANEVQTMEYPLPLLCLLDCAAQPLEQNPLLAPPHP